LRVHLCGNGANYAVSQRKRYILGDHPHHSVGCRIQGVGLRAQGSGFGVQGSRFRVQGSGFRVQVAGFRV